MLADCVCGPRHSRGFAPLRKEAYGNVYVKNGTPRAGESKCVSCVHAHILRGYRESEEVIYCTLPYGPPLKVPFKVYECSCYLDRNRPTWKQMEDLAIDILPLSSGKPAGFRVKTKEEADQLDPETVSR